VKLKTPLEQLLPGVIAFAVFVFLLCPLLTAILDTLPKTIRHAISIVAAIALLPLVFFGIARRRRSRV